MDNLVNAGYPPVFIFLYDQPWKMCLRLFDAMCPILNDKEATLEASMHAWALQKQPKNQFIKEKVGGNFGVPHRDITYKNCHSIDGSPDILSLWIPLVDVSTDNGCMMVIPRECDPQFDQDTNPKDQDPFSHKMQYASIKPLSPISAGTTLVWHPNLIHWGAACSYSSELPPRKSIAMAFRVRDSKRESTPKEIDRYGRIPFTRSELLAGGPDFKARLRMIVKSLMLYNVWYPKYEGLEIEKIAS
jgi:ectoine hydroxylase-related dioxygenase (phytanoyl-CoA dioxygenase family)